MQGIRLREGQRSSSLSGIDAPGSVNLNTGKICVFCPFKQQAIKWHILKVGELNPSQRATLSKSPTQVSLVEFTPQKAFFRLR